MFQSTVSDATATQPKFKDILMLDNLCIRESEGLQKLEQFYENKPEGIKNKELWNKEFELNKKIDPVMYKYKKISPVKLKRGNSSIVLASSGEIKYPFKEGYQRSPVVVKKSKRLDHRKLDIRDYEELINQERELNCSYLNSFSNKKL